MVLWEVALGTAYFLGLKRTYKLALKAQRKLISPNHPKIRAFIYGRTRGVLDMAVTVHKKIRQSDIQAGRNLGSWIVRCLDKMKPAAEIRAKHSIDINSKRTIGQLIISQKQKLSKNFRKYDLRSLNRDSNRNLFSAPRNIWRRNFPTITMMMRPMKPAGMFFQQRQFNNGTPEALTPYYGRFGSGVVRKDIIQWMQK
ncbi:hypothetical protein Leryth_010532 [Lithospermum erythrorhizon]|nr:hypothetical protein Leryth_010532 [Lithospermum erythrorhizon]